MPKKLRNYQELAKTLYEYAQRRPNSENEKITKDGLLEDITKIFGITAEANSEYWQCREFLHEYYQWYNKSPETNGKKHTQPTQPNTATIDAHLKTLMNALEKALPHLNSAQQQIRFYEIAGMQEENQEEDPAKWWSDLDASGGLVYQTLKKHFVMRSQGGRSKNALIDSMVEPLVHFWMDVLKKGYTPSFEASEYAKNGVRMPTGEMACFIFCTLAVELPEQSLSWIISIPAKLKNYRSIAMSRTETRIEFT